MVGYLLLTDSTQHAFQESVYESLSVVLHSIKAHCIL